MSNITRDKIEQEEDYKKLQAIGKDFEADGHGVKLNASKADLKAELLKIFDEHYAEQGEDEEADDIVDEAVEKADAEATELGEDDESQEEAEEGVEEAAEEQPDPAPEPEDDESADEEEQPKQELWVARQGRYKLWTGEGEYVEFDARFPKPMPKVKKDFRPQLEQAIKMKRIVRYVEE